MLALGPGVTTLGLDTVAVTDALLSRVEVSVLVGLPVGLAAAALVGGLTFLAVVRGGGPAWHRHLATAAGRFGGLTLVTCALGIGIVGLGNAVALPIAVGVGALVAISRYHRQRRTREGPSQSAT